MKLRAEPGSRVNLRPDSLPYIPRYSPRGLFVTVGPHDDSRSHETLLRETFGSTDWLWSAEDEFRFDKVTRDIRGLVLSTPESHPEEGWSPQPWFDIEPVPGHLRAEVHENFGAPPMDTRWISADGGWIVCADSAAGTRSTDVLRVRLAESLDLVFVEGTLVGWMLENPAKYLVSQWETPPRSDVSSEMKLAFRDFLSLFSEPNIDDMQSGDYPSRFETLKALRRRIVNLPPDPRRDPLLEFIDVFYEDWRPG